MPAQKKKTGKARKAADSEKTRRGSGKESAGRWFERLVKLQARLRAPNGCPWDIEQTHLTLRTYLIESGCRRMARQRWHVIGHGRVEMV